MEAGVGVGLRGRGDAGDGVIVLSGARVSEAKRVMKYREATEV